MPDHTPTAWTRRQLLKRGALLAAAPILAATRPAHAQAPAKSTTVLDFKTGAAPSKDQVKFGFSPQLTLTAAILNHGRFDGLPSLKSGELVYVQVTGRNPAGLEVVRAEKDESLEAGELAFAGLVQVLRRYNDPNTPYLSRVAPQFVKTYASDYDHLARVYEWSSGGDEGGDE